MSVVRVHACPSTRRPSVVVAQVVVPDEDIFDDAGEYDLSKRAQEDVK